MEQTAGRQHSDTNEEEAPARLAERFGFDRFTIAIAAGAVILVAALLLVLLGQPKDSVPVDESQAAGVVHNYYLALMNDDPRTAYGYLSAETQSKTSYEQFVSRTSARPSGRRIRIDEQRIEGDTARVVVRQTYSRGGLLPFTSNEYTQDQTVILRLESGAWKMAPVGPSGGVP